MSRKTLLTILSAAMLATALAILFHVNNNSQYQFVQIPLPTDVTPPLGHGRERLSVPSGNSVKQQRPTGEPVQATNLGSMTFRHLDNTVVGELSFGIDLFDGEVIVTANGTQQGNQFSAGTIASQLDLITLGKDNIVQAIVDKTNNTITIRSLHKGASIQLSVMTLSGWTHHQVNLLDGQEITLPIRSSYRTVYLTAEQLDELVKPSDFVAIVKASPVLQRMRNSSNKEDRKVYATAEKTAAVLKLFN